MARTVLRYVIGLVMILAITRCATFRGPDRTGEIQLSSQLFGSDTYYLLGYSYEDSEFYRYPYQGEPVPDIINEGFRVYVGNEQVVLPGFNTPGQMNGFALVGEFESRENARTFYEEYAKVENDLQFETVSDTVELFQVWVQQTAAGNYVKLYIKEVEIVEGESGTMFSEVAIDYTYQPNGSATFPN